MRRIAGLILLLSVAFLPSYATAAAKKEAALEITANPDHADHLYNCGDSAVFTVELNRAAGEKEPVAVSYRFSEDGETTLKTGTLKAVGARLRLSGVLDLPGFLRLELTAVSGTDTARTVAACGYEPNAIQPTNVLPPDFDRFWRNARAELNRIPLDARVEQVQDSSLAGRTNYQVSLANVGGTRVYGHLALSEGAGPFPAVLQVPGAGVGLIRPGGEFVQAGFATLAIDIHGILQDQPDLYYNNLRSGLLAGYQYFGCDDPYQFYYRRVILGCIRALDYLASRPDVDTTRLAIAGSSQGGALSLLTAGLDKRIRALIANVPAMCDHTGQLHGRPSGWPRLLRTDSRDEVVRTSAYYDAALNAGLISVPARLGVGFIDNTCAPTTVYAAYNNLKGTKLIDNFPEMSHAYGKGWLETSVAWLKERLNESAGKK